jgi:hypothetical protein
MLGASRSIHVRGRRAATSWNAGIRRLLVDRFASIWRARQRRPTPRAFQLLQLTLARL